MSPISSVPEDPDIMQRRLLQSIVEVARSLFGAAAASVFLFDHATGDLVFEAVAGEGAGWLPGTRLPGGTGIVGWVAVCGQPMIVDDVSESSLFAGEAAESTGFVPRSIMAVPLIHGGECVGVLEVLDRDSRQRCDVGDMDSLGLLATEIATVLELLIRIRWLGAGMGSPSASPGMSLLQRVAERLPAAPEPVSATVTKLLAMADELLGDSGAAVGVVHA